MRLQVSFYLLNKLCFPVIRMVFPAFEAFQDRLTKNLQEMNNPEGQTPVPSEKLGKQQRPARPAPCCPRVPLSNPAGLPWNPRSEHSAFSPQHLAAITAQTHRAPQPYPPPRLRVAISSPSRGSLAAPSCRRGDRTSAARLSLATSD